VCPYVFLRNASPDGIARIVKTNPDGARENDVPVSNDLKAILLQLKACISRGDESIIKDLLDSELEPSKSIFEAMKSIVSREEPFILTKDQERAVDRIRKSMRAGKHVIRVTGPAGSGKTAILLNLYVRITASRSRSGRIPIFISGRQNAALYRSAYQ
jgi:tRNA(Met) C34 N-acetyltransferase TmcA